jgi:hypothetical protein
LDVARKLYEDLARVEADKDRTASRIKDELYKIIKNLPPSGSREYRQFKRNFHYFLSNYLLKNEIRELLLTFGSFRLSEKKDISYLLFSYLGLVEILGNSFSDILVLLLVTTGIEFHIERMYMMPRIKHASHLEDLKKTPLRIKLDFLDENGLKSFASVFNTDLRNAIAHMNFTIRDNDLYIGDKPATTKALVELHRLVYGCSAVGEVLLGMTLE